MQPSWRARQAGDRRLPSADRLLRPLPPRRRRPAARAAPRLHRQLAHLGPRAAGARAPPRRARAGARRPRRRATARRRGRRDDLLADAVERAMDEAGFETAHIAGNSLGGYIALQLAARGRARSVVALAPGRRLGARRRVLPRDARPLPRAVRAGRRRSPRTRTGSSPRRRASAARRSTRRSTTSTSPPSCSSTRSAPSPRATGFPMSEYAKREGYQLDAERITCPVRSCGGPRTSSCPGPRPPAATSTSGSRTPTGSSSRAWATARSSTSRSRRRS